MATTVSRYTDSKYACVMYFRSVQDGEHSYNGRAGFFIFLFEGDKIAALIRYHAF
jgi:hypothetical protein